MIIDYVTMSEGNGNGQKPGDLVRKLSDRSLSGLKRNELVFASEHVRFDPEHWNTVADSLLHHAKEMCAEEETSSSQGRRYLIVSFI